jgi:hypothetical protein
MIFMSEEDFLDVSNCKKCSECGCYYDNQLSRHSVDDCNLAQIGQVMKS